MYLLSYIDWFEVWIFGCSNCSIDAFQRANNKGVDQSGLHICCSHTQTGFLLNSSKELFQLSSGVLDLVKRLERNGEVCGFFYVFRTFFGNSVMKHELYYDVLNERFYR